MHCQGTSIGLSFLLNKFTFWLVLFVQIYLNRPCPIEPFPGRQIRNSIDPSYRTLVCVVFKLGPLSPPSGWLPSGLVAIVCSSLFHFGIASTMLFDFESFLDSLGVWLNFSFVAFSSLWVRLGGALQRLRVLCRFCDQVSACPALYCLSI